MLPQRENSRRDRGGSLEKDRKRTGESKRGGERWLVFKLIWEGVVTLSQHTAN